MVSFLWLIPVLPLAGFIFINLFKRQLPQKSAGVLASLAIGVSFIISLSLFLDPPALPLTVRYFDWLQAGTLSVDASFRLDEISSVMLLIVTGVGLLIHIYSIGYMHGDEAFKRFFAQLNLFVFFMLVLVLGSNYA